MPRVLASRMSRLGTETAFEVLARAKALEATGKNIVHLEIGEPDFDTPANIVRAGQAALGSGHTHYVAAAGLPELRAAITADSARARGVEHSAAEVLVCPGAKPVMFYMILALIEDGDEVIYPNPGFPIYESMINFAGGRAVPVPLLEENGFSFDLAAFEKLLTPRTKLVILNSPSNPTGGVLSADLLEGIARLAVERDFWVLSDEIYCRVLYEGKHSSIAALPGMRERTVILDGFSKIYSMTGWRLGYALGPKELINQMTRLQVNSASCTAPFTQLAGCEALTGPQEQPAHMVAVFRQRRDRIVAGLNAVRGVSCASPAGAFYAFPNILGTGMKSQPCADLLLNEAGVAVLPGTSFGAHGEGHIRLSYANSMENIDKALARMERLFGRK
ncbi:MAG: pyridoxal phosphate-dependent aminotransferase [Planctomycetes bacterium]|nr:pyridoxal phosphate-dependent aminotransferase [Planctomycetota bacterium]